MAKWVTGFIGILLVAVATATGVLFFNSPTLLKSLEEHVGELLVLLVGLSSSLAGAWIIMRSRALGSYLPELLVLLVGLTTGLIAEVVITNDSIGVITVLISFLLAVSTFSVKREISERIATVSKLHVALERIHKTRWRTEANERIEELEMEIGGWASGRRTLPHERSIPYQIELLASASRSVDAIHIALSRKALLLWDREFGKFSAMVEAHASLSKSVSKRRIIVVDDTDAAMVTNTSGLRKLTDPDAVRVCNRQIAASPEGLGVDLRILWKSHVTRVDREPPRDLLLVDDDEAIVVTIREGSQAGNGAGDHKYETEVYVDPTLVRAHRRRFEAYWAVATPADRALGSPPVGP